MNILISGGGNVGTLIAGKLISEGHNVTLIEKNKKLIKSLQSELDAMIIHGNCIDSKIQDQANIGKTDIFLALTNQDKVNLISCIIAKQLNKKLIVLCKLEETEEYFNNALVRPANFSINSLIDPVQLSVEKILDLLQNPETIEVVHFENKKCQLSAVTVNDNFKFIGKSIGEIKALNKDFSKLNVALIDRNSEILLPDPTTTVLSSDILYLIGKTSSIVKITKDLFSPDYRIERIIIIGGNKLGINLAQEFTKKRKKVTIIENDINKCLEISRTLKNVLVINGSAIKKSVIEEVKVENTLTIALTEDDEYNVLSSVTAKKYNAVKTICLIRNNVLVPVINTMPGIDIVFSPHSLAIGEILRFCRKSEILSIHSFLEIEGETINVKISETHPLLHKKLNQIQKQEGLVVGAIIRGKEFIIPDNDTEFQIDDNVIMIVLSTTLAKVEEKNLKKELRGNK